MAARRGEAIQNRLADQTAKQMTSDDLPMVTICLVTHNSQNWLEAWFEGLSQSSYPKTKLSLSITDNASSDNTSDTIERLVKKHNFSHSTKFHKSESNLGFGKGQNLAISNAKSEFILVINPDAVLKPDSLLNAVKFALYDEADICAWEFAQLPFEHPKYYDPVTLETSWNSHACVLLKTSAHTKVGGYDKNLFMYGEDVDLSYKLRLAGFRLRYLPWARVTHNSLERYGKRSEQSFRIMAANLCLRRRYGTLHDKIIGYLLFFRTQFSRDPDIRHSMKKAWPLYRKMRSNFTPVKRMDAYFPFNGFGFDRNRPNANVSLDADVINVPKISVITRVHKKTDILGESLLTVVNQTYSNIEHIVVFDKCVPYLISNQKIIQNNFSTRSEAANAGAEAATGDYLLFLDYDDLLFSDHLEGLMSAFKANPKAVCTYAISWEAMTDNRLLGRDQYMGIQVGMEAVFEPDSLKIRNSFAIQSVLIKKSAFMEVDGFNKGLDMLEDWDLWKRLAKLGDFKANSKVTSIFYTPSHLATRLKRSLDLT
ncbi:MAG: glycosyltransferase family 2 protein [Maricaulaceae bacterium]